jgi:hypothetical protein
MGATECPGSYDDRLERGEYRRRPRPREAAGPLVASLWSAACRLGCRGFADRRRRCSAAGSADETAV